MKRAANSLDNESSSKRVKVVKTDRINHATDCSDPHCEGCDVGEVELTFTNEDGSAAETPSALELFHMAMDEAASEGSKSNENGMAKKIFDLALEAYEKEKDEDPLGYAQCLIEFGRYFDVIESVKEGVDILRGLEKNAKKEESSVSTSELYISKGRGILVQLQIERAKRIEIFEEIRQENSDEDDIEPAVLKKLEVTKPEMKLIDEAILSFDKVNMKL
jgi:tetratricopeptide (TPR) repeat protein